MSRPGRGLGRAAAAGFAVAVAAATPAGPALAGTQAAGQGPVVKMIAAQNNITVARYGRQVYLDPGIWVASLGSAFQLDLQRPDYSTPMTVTQVVGLPGGGTQQIAGQRRRGKVPGYSGTSSA